MFIKKKKKWRNEINELIDLCFERKLLLQMKDGYPLNKKINYLLLVW